MSLVEKSRKGSDMTKNDIHHIYLSRIFFIKLNSSPFDYPAVIALLYMSFPDGSDDKESGCSAGDLGSILGSGWSPGEGNGYLLEYSCLESAMDRGALAGYSPWDCKESDTTEWPTLSLSLTCMPLSPRSVSLIVFAHIRVDYPLSPSLMKPASGSPSVWALKMKQFAFAN